MQNCNLQNIAVIRLSKARLPTCYGEFVIYAYKDPVDNSEHLALVKGTISPLDPVLVRVHSECLTGDVFGSIRCDCGQQLSLALQKISEKGSGVLVYLRGHEGRGIGLAHKLKAYQLQDKGLDTVDANLDLGFPVDSREYGIAGDILFDLGVKIVSLMTNNPKKCLALEHAGLEIKERIPLLAPPHRENMAYLITKKLKMGHLIDVEDRAL